MPFPVPFLYLVALSLAWHWLGRSQSSPSLPSMSAPSRLSGILADGQER